MATAVPDTAFDELFVTDTPFIDVRAEVEFERGRFPTAVNLPILTTDERVAVGTTYKREGQIAAIELGHKLVSGDVKARRIEAWCDFAAEHPGTHVYCWRGGMRSNLAQAWMREAGIDVPVVRGGFKALRRRLIGVLEETAAHARLCRIGGRTGCDKTGLINALEGGIDLEGHAHHRGSSFGRHATPPPAQIDFENSLAIDLLKRRRLYTGALFVEDESRRIGPVGIPLELFEAMQRAPMVVVERPLAERIAVIRRDYVEDLLAEYNALGGDDPFGAFSEHLLASLGRITKRLGRERHRRAAALMREAFARHREGDAGAHDAWIELLLTGYYDPLYSYQLGRSEHTVVFRGRPEEVLAWAQRQA